VGGSLSLAQGLKDVLLGLRQPIFARGLVWFRGQLRTIRKDLLGEGLLGFADLLLLARDLLREHEDVRAFFQKRFRLVLLDEFQDTDPLQVEIAFYLCEDGAQTENWRECRLVPGKLCLVADPKQSIYRFRRADIETYLHVKGLIENEKEGEILEITRNFRSVPAVTGWVNGLFPGLMTSDGGTRRAQADYAPLVPNRDDPCGGVRLFAEGVAGKKDDVRPAEQAEVAKLILHVIGNPDFKIQDRGSGAWRPPRYGDVGVLYPKRTNYAGIEDILHESSIPFVSDVGTAFYAREEVRDVVAILSAMEHSHDSVRLYAALHSPLLGFGDVDLAELAMTGPLDLARPPSDLPTAFQETFALLQRLHENRNRRPFAVTLRELLDETRAFSFYGESPRQGPRRVALLETLVARAGEADREGGCCFADFIEDLEVWMGEEKKEEGEAPLSFGGKDAVTLLTVHQAKGLEFPIVIMAHLCAEQMFKGEVLAEMIPQRIPAPGLQVRNRLPYRGGEDETTGFVVAASEEERFDRAEKVRLLYVACTRARDWLFITRAHSDRGDTFADLLWAGGTGGASVLDVEDGEAPARQKGFGRRQFRDALLEDRAHWIDKRSALIADRDDVFSVVHPSLAGKEVQTGSKWAVEDEGHGLLPVPLKSPDLDLSDGSDAAAFGTAFHRLMALIDLDRVKCMDTTTFVAAQEPLAARLVCEEGLDSSRTAELLTCLSITIESDLFQRALSADLILRETPLMYPHEDGSRVQGVIDLLFREGKTWTVVDYKTDRVVGVESMKTAAIRYESQMEFYSKGVMKYFDVSSVEMNLLFTRNGQVEKIT
jgi:ATP-dependent helicase/nuclease subunit A